MLQYIFWVFSIKYTDIDEGNEQVKEITVCSSGNMNSEYFKEKIGVFSIECLASWVGRI